MRKLPKSPVSRNAGRARLLTSVAALAVVTATPALAQQTVILPEGSTHQGDVALNGNDRLVVDISRINADTAELNLGEHEGRQALLTGSLTSTGGEDTLWLRASSTQTRDIAFTVVGNTHTEQRPHAGGFEFTGGTIYEASGNDTELTLQNRSRAASNPQHVLRHDPLMLAGDGTIVLDLSLQGDQADAAAPDRAIVVVPVDSVTGDGRLDLVIKGWIDGNTGLNAQGQLDENIGLIDVRNANSVRFATNSQVTAGNHTLVLGGDAAITIERNAILSIKSDAHGAHPGRVIRSSGVVRNAGRIDATSNGDDAPTETRLGDRGVGLYLEGADFYNTLTEGAPGTGAVLGGQYGVQVASGDNFIHNVGLIRSVNGAAIATEDGSTVFRNAIYTFANGTRRAGEVTGGGLNGAKVAYQDIGVSQDLVVNSGTITGDVLLGEGSDTFLFTEATNGVAGLIDGGDGFMDAYGRSVSTSGTVTFGNDLNTDTIRNFEMHGLELNGANLNVSIAAAGDGTLANGVKVLGAGTVTNNAKIDDADGVGILLEHYAQLPGGIDFVNAADITALYGVIGDALIKSFKNSAVISSGQPAFAYFHGGVPTQALEFDNAGSLISSQAAGESGGTVIVRLFNEETPVDAVLANLRNSNLIRTTFSSVDPTFALTSFGVELRNGGLGRMTLSNTGTIEATGVGGIGVGTFGGGYAVTNSQLIQSTGAGGAGVLMRDANGDGRVDQFTNTVDGTVRANAGGFTGGQYGRTFAFGVGASGIANGGAARIDNAGLIEATGANSIAVAAIGLGDSDSNHFTVNNTGTIRGGGDTIVAEGQGVADDTLGLGEVLGDEGEERVVAGAIQTWRTTDLIRNDGTIIGSVDLGQGDDRFEHYGTLDGNLRMGEGTDTFVFGSGTLTAGRTVSGGAGEDTILADMSGAADKTIDAAQFKQFERIQRLAGAPGTGKLFVRGMFDANTLFLDNLTIHIAAGDEVATQQILTFQGGDGEETIYNAGVIAEGVALGGGRDSLFNSGEISHNTVSMGEGDDTVTNAQGGRLLNLQMDGGNDTFTNAGLVNGDVMMGEGNDVVINSGTIEGDLDLGDGDDRYEANGGGTVMGHIEGGLGNDTFVFRLQNSTGSIPGGFDGFESFAAYGPGTLQLALNRDYNTLEILEGANLELTNAANWDVELIKGDDSSQTVKIDAGFNGSVHLYGGDDTLEMSLGGLLAGDLDGGDGVDTLKLNLTAASSINDLFGFENISVAGTSPLTLEGELGAGQKITFDASDNEFIIAENAVFKGQADGGAGNNTLRIATGAAGSRTIVAGQLANFQQVFSQGEGTLAFNGGTYDFASFEATGGNLSVGGGAILAATGGIRFTGDVDNRFTLEHGGKVNSQVDGGDGDADVLAFAQGAGQTQNVSAVDAVNFEILAASGDGVLQIDTDFSIDQVQLEGGNIKVLENVTLTAQVVGGAGNDTFDNAGTVVGNILLGDGDDTYVARTGSFVDGTVDGGVGGNDTVVYSLNDDVGSLLDNVINFESIGVYGPGTLNLALATDYNSIKLMEGANLDLTDAGGSVGQIIGDDSAQTVTIGSALTGGVSLGGGDDTLNMDLGGVLTGTLDGGAGTDTLNLNLTAASTINGMANFEIANITGAHALTLGGALGATQRINFDASDNELIIAEGAVFQGTVDGGAGQNLLRIQSGASDSRTVVASQILNFQDLIAEGAGTLALTGGAYDFDSVQFFGGNLELGTNTSLHSDAGVMFDDGDNRLTLGSGAVITGGVDAGGGDGIDTLALIQAQGFTRTWSGLNVAGFEALETTGAGELRFDVDATFTNGVSLNGGLTTVLAGATLTANVLGGDAAETLAVLGKLNGDIDLGAGDDRLIVAGDLGTGLRSGGAGSNTLEFRTNSTYGAPTVYDAARYENFDKLAVSGGVLSMTSDSSWKSLTLTGGRLIGQAGTVLTSESPIEVGAGAVFGSAGVVNADINVRGTLSPGASPGTMTVNGDVNFYAGSNLYLELSPEVSDLLNIHGKMNIANGATIDITGVLPSTPGAVLDLIVASEGIEGRFTTINKSETVFGFVAQNGNKLQIRGEFQNDDDFGTNAQRSIAYSNAVLASGQAVQAFTQAVPVLVDANGVSNAEAFEQLTPEAYGSALSIGTETALAVVDTARGLTFGAPKDEGFYAFAQGLALDARVDGLEGTGAASADFEMGGAFGGLGYSTGSGFVGGAFIGRTMGEQDLKDLGATTKSEGIIAGGFVSADLNGLNLNGLVSYDQTEARTHRNMAATPESARGLYELRTWTADFSVAYPVSMGGVTVTPIAGVTWIATERDTVNEVTGGDFALLVEADRKSGWYADAGVTLSTTMALEGRTFMPYVQAGFRQALSNDDAGVVGTLSQVHGVEIEVDGVLRDRSVARLATGFSYAVDPAVTFNAGYVGEYGDNDRHNVGLGVSLKF